MRIKKIILSNFGSYEGYNSFDIGETAEKNIILIGGKNGAGKTTLFTAMRLCLYGYLSMGYKNAGAFYTRTVTKLINNNAKLRKPCKTSISLEIELNNDREIDNYIIVRSWTLNDDFIEDFVVIKNDIELSYDETADFEKYILSLIPPELFNLYFFDGEKIADFFLNDGGNTRIKEAFLTLCGYDTFDIMSNNFKRVHSSKKGQTNTCMNSYTLAKENLHKAKDLYDKLQTKLLNSITEIENCNAEIIKLEKKYTNSGGITQDEWNQKILMIKDEEHKRETLNMTLKKWANDVIPFIMIPSVLKQIKLQIEKENNNNKYKHFMEILDNPEISDLITDNREKIKEIVLKKCNGNENRIFDLSIEQSVSVIAKISDFLNFNKTKVRETKNSIEQSIKKTVALRKEIEESNITVAQEYMRTKAEIFEKKSKLQELRIILEKQVATQKANLNEAMVAFNKAQIEMEVEIRKESISDISSRAIIMLDKLQADLYKKQIDKVEENFRYIVNILMRKEKFIDNIFIDDKFNIHIFRNEKIEGKVLKNFLLSNTKEQFLKTFGFSAFKTLIERYGNNIFEKKNFNFNYDEEIILPVEIDKNSFSNGEKQIFIMSLYYALMKIGNHKIPFVIDTPFARIDTEHREKIAKYFFNELNGQVFILSTDEELNKTHIKLLKNKILQTYLLENVDNKKTIIKKNVYFGD